MIRLSESDSLPRVEDASERHMRLCDQNSGADKYTKSLTPYYTTFEEKLAAKQQAQKNVNSSLDGITLSEQLLNEALRKVHGRSKEYDTEHPGNHTTTLLFPNGNSTAITDLSMDSKPDRAHDLSLKIVSLGKDHPLYPLAAEIDTAVEFCSQKEKAHATAEKANDEAKTALYVAKIALVKQYNTNFHTAAADVDNNYAEKLFPKIRKEKKKTDDTNPPKPGK